MRILDSDTDRALDGLLLEFDEHELAAFANAIEQLLRIPLGDHDHVYNEDYQKEVTVTVYDPDDLTRYNERSKRLITEGL